MSDTSQLTSTHVSMESFQQLLAEYVKRITAVMENYLTCEALVKCRHKEGEEFIPNFNDFHVFLLKEINNFNQNVNLARESSEMVEFNSTPFYLFEATLEGLVNAFREEGERLRVQATYTYDALQAIREILLCIKHNTVVDMVIEKNTFIIEQNKKDTLERQSAIAYHREERQKAIKNQTKKLCYYVKDKPEEVKKLKDKELVMLQKFADEKFYGQLCKPYAVMKKIYEQFRKKNHLPRPYPQPPPPPPPQKKTSSRAAKSLGPPPRAAMGIVKMMAPKGSSESPEVVDKASERFGAPEDVEMASDISRDLEDVEMASEGSKKKFKDHRFINPERTRTQEDMIEVDSRIPAKNASFEDWKKKSGRSMSTDKRKDPLRKYMEPVSTSSPFKGAPPPYFPQRQESESDSDDDEALDLSKFESFQMASPMSQFPSPYNTSPLAQPRRRYQGPPAQVLRPPNMGPPLEKRKSFAGSGGSSSGGSSSSAAPRTPIHHQPPPPPIPKRWQPMPRGFSPKDSSVPDAVQEVVATPSTGRKRKADTSTGEPEKKKRDVDAQKDSNKTPKTPGKRAEPTVSTGRTPRAAAVAANHAIVHHQHHKQSVPSTSTPSSSNSAGESSQENPLDLLAELSAAAEIEEEKAAAAKTPNRKTPKRSTPPPAKTPTVTRSGRRSSRGNSLEKEL